MPDFGRWTAGGGDPSLNEINRADRFIDALSTNQPVYSTDAAEAELAFLFADWRDDVRDAPITAPVTARDAVDALQSATTRRRSRGSLALVGTVAAAMLCVGGFGAAVYGSGPGDSLYGMRSSLFGTQEATRDDQVSLASAQLQQVQQLIDKGQWQQAQDKLVEVSSQVQGVDRVESKQQLVEQWNALTYKVVEQNPAATLPPGEPLPELPSSPLTWLPVPVVEATSTPSSSTTSNPADTTTDITATTSQSAATSSAPTSTDASGVPIPPEVPPPTTTPDAPATTSTAPATTSAPVPTAAPATTAPPTPGTSTATTSTAATTTTSAAPTRPAQPTAPPAAIESPAASAPRVVPSSPRPEVTAAETAVPSQAKPPATTAAPQEPAAAPSSAAATTTVVAPR